MDVEIHNENIRQTYEAFDRYAQTHDRFLIESFSLEEIEFALVKCLRDRGSPAYVAMENRREELLEEKRLMRLRDIWWENPIHIILGIIMVLIGFFLMRWIISP
jgi:hypothetical protein